MARLSEIAAATGGRLVGEDAEFLGAVIDSRECKAGQLFVALPGAQVDGHEFIAAAAESGAVAALVCREQSVGIPQIVVDDVLESLQVYACVHRQQFKGPVIAVTGTNGKTSTKEILAAVLAEEMGGTASILFTQGNLNNHIGVPLTLLGLAPEHRAAVIEMGANHAGEIALLARIARPDVGIVTLAGAGHLEGFGSVEGVAHAKGELFSGLSEAGIAIINSDDDYAELWRELASHCQQISFGFNESANVRAENLIQKDADQTFRLHTPVGEAKVSLPMSGKHNVMNALAASAAAIAIGLSVDSVAKGLAAAHSVGGRLHILSGPNGSRIVDDSYNANPTSVKAALDWLSVQPGRRWFAFGAMAELGDDAASWHSKVGDWARAAGVQKLYVFNDLTRHTAKAFGDDAVQCESHEHMAAYLSDAFKSGESADVTLLVKGSRSAYMERVVKALTQTANESGSHAVAADQVANGR